MGGFVHPVGSFARGLMFRIAATPISYQLCGEVNRILTRIFSLYNMGRVMRVKSRRSDPMLNCGQGGICMHQFVFAREFFHDGSFDQERESA